MFLFNDVLNTFVFNLRLYGVRHMVKDHSDSHYHHMGYSFRLMVWPMTVGDHNNYCSSVQTDQKLAYNSSKLGTGYMVKDCTDKD